MRLQGLLTPWRLIWYPRCLLATLALGFIIAVTSGHGASIISGRLGGDYPAYYGAGRIIGAGHSRELYSQNRQLESQKGLFPGIKGYMPFPYPPYVALAYWPLSQLGYRISFILHTLLMVLALVGALQLIRPMIPEIDRYFLATFTLLLFFYPVLRSVLGGQNTPITLLLVAAAWRAATDNHEFRAGLFLGLLLFKPQFALPLIGLFVLSGRWRVGMGSLITAVGLYAIGVCFQGWNWVVNWFQFASWVSKGAAVIDPQNAVCWLGFFEALLGADTMIAKMIGWPLVFGTILGISWIWWSSGKKGDLAAQMGLATLSMVLIPPHVMYYDLGLLFFTYSVLLSRGLSRKFETIGAVWIASFSQPFSYLTGFSVLFIIEVFTCIVAGYNLVDLAVKRKDELAERVA